MKKWRMRSRAGRVAAGMAVALATLFTATALSAQPDTVLPDDPAGAGNENAVVQGSGCPNGRSVICYYDSTGFRNYLGSTPVSSCSGYSPLRPAMNNRVEAVRNRTGCRIYLVYYCGTERCYQEAMVPHSDDNQIVPLNQIDEVHIRKP